MLFSYLEIFAVITLLMSAAQARYSSSKPNVFYYWGQNSAGGSSTQSSLATYCDSGLVDGVILSFLHVFNIGGDPGMNFAGACKTTFPDSNLLSCPNIASDIKTCQSKGIKVILSLGGASGSYGFDSDSQAKTFADTLWNLFGGGSAEDRPFGDTEIDGIDLDIEGGQPTGYVSLVNAVRSKFGSDFLVGAAPQCPFPDVILGSVIDSVGFDYVNVQFYNNYCSAAGGSFNFDTWAKWATSTSPNKNVKVLFTIPGSSTAAGTGYAPISTIQSIVPKLASEYPNTFGGVSVWDASQAWNNGDFASALYRSVKSGDSAPSYSTDKKSSESSSSVETATTAIASATISSPAIASATVSNTQNQKQYVKTNRLCSKLSKSKSTKSCKKQLDGTKSQSESSGPEAGHNKRN